MQKVVTYLYPDVKKASSLKVFQDRTNQIRAFYFTRDNINLAEGLESATNYAVYFLFDESPEDERTKVYVGQSKNGIARIGAHKNKKLFWSYCVLFVTDNNSFDTAAIDYIEYHFINKLQKSSSYLLENVDMRKNPPIVSIYDRPTLLSYIEQIEFLLMAEGINLEEQKKERQNKYYYPQDSRYKARIYFQNGQFYLVAGSFIRGPIDTAQDWSDGGRFYNRYTSIINDLLQDKKIEEAGNGYKTMIDLSFKSPSRIACLISGRSENGWKFFKNLDELRTD